MTVMIRLLAAFLLAAGAAAPALADGFTDAQRAEIVEILRQALKADPTILRDAVTAMRADDEKNQQQAARGAIAASRSELVDGIGDPAVGNPKGDVTVVEFFDIRCPYCRQIEQTLADLIAQDGNVRLVFKDMPILGPGSVTGAKALLAAHRQDNGDARGYMKLRAALMKPGPEPTDESLRATADKAGLDGARLIADMQDPTIQARIDANLKLAEKLNVHGTPAMVVGDTLVPGAVSLKDLSQLVAQTRGHSG
jgi:protein-disulfide isomerase